MAEAAVPTRVVASTGPASSFVWRRLHSLSGVLPVGLYLCYHIFENMSALRGPQPYDEMVNHVNTLLPRGWFYLVEFGVVIGPLLFHSLYGFYVASTGQSNVNAYPYGSNWAYWFQRLTGYVAFLYLIVHVGVLRVMVTFFGQHLGPYSGPATAKLDLVTYNDVAAHLGNPDLMMVRSWAAGTHIFVLYIVGTLLTIFHFTNGLNGFAWTWGIAVGRIAQKRVKVFGWILFVALSAATLNILFTMRFGGSA
jgi:succinate dehydrogenase / fumarate reductase, cytochrome b subunit